MGSKGLQLGTSKAWETTMVDLHSTLKESEQRAREVLAEKHYFGENHEAIIIDSHARLLHSLALSYTKKIEATVLKASLKF